MMDDLLISNTYGIVDHKELEVEDIDFPMHALFYSKANSESQAINYNVEDYDHLKHLAHLKNHVFFRLAWGFGSVVKDSKYLLSHEPPLKDYHFSGNISVSFGLNLSIVNNKPYINYNANFKHHVSRVDVFKYFGLEELSYDDFKIRFEGYTRQEYLELLKTFEK